MDGAKLHARIYAGRAQAARRIGLPCQVYRPVTVASPFSNQIATLYASFDAGDGTYSKPNLYSDPSWFVDLDGRKTQPGDYLVRSDGDTWFIAAQQQLLPIVGISCNRSVTVLRQAPVTTAGARGYSGLVAPAHILGTKDVLWPASILLAGRALASTGLPADVKNAGWRILLPPSVSIRLMSADLIRDDQGRTFAIESAEQSDLGWRLGCTEVHT